MYKGDLVRFNTDHEKIKHQVDMGKDYFNALRPSTLEDRETWKNSNTNKEMNSAGETKLPPMAVWVPLSIDGIFIVERARCRAQLGWGNKTPGLAKIIDPESGSIAFVKREMLEVLK